MALKIAQVRAPFASELARVVGHSESLLYRRGTFNGTVDDLICSAIMSERDCRDRAVARLPLGEHNSPRYADHGRGYR